MATFLEINPNPTPTSFRHLTEMKEKILTDSKVREKTRGRRRPSDISNFSWTTTEISWIQSTPQRQKQV